MRIFGGHRGYDRFGVAEVAQTSLLLLSYHERDRGGCPRGLGIHEAVDIEKLCPVKIVGHVFLALGLSHCGLLTKSPATTRPASQQKSELISSTRNQSPGVGALLRLHAYNVMLVQYDLFGIILTVAAKSQTLCRQKIQGIMRFVRTIYSR
jgi:hypothetical protein